jgi:hypothetical protein
MFLSGGNCGNKYKYQDKIESKWGTKYINSNTWGTNDKTGLSLQIQ